MEVVVMASDGKGDGVDLGRIQKAVATAHALLAARPQQMRDERADWNMRLDSWRDQLAPLLELVRQTIPPLVDGRRVNVPCVYRGHGWVGVTPIDVPSTTPSYPGVVRTIIGEESVEPGWHLLRVVGLLHVVSVCADLEIPEHSTPMQSPWTLCRFAAFCDDRGARFVTNRYGSSHIGRKEIVTVEEAVPCSLETAVEWVAKEVASYMAEIICLPAEAEAKRQHDPRQQRSDSHETNNVSDRKPPPESMPLTAK
jgi:hypothetical protein